MLGSWKKYVMVGDGQEFVDLSTWFVANDGDSKDHQIVNIDVWLERLCSQLRAKRSGQATVELSDLSPVQMYTLSGNAVIAAGPKSFGFLRYTKQHGNCSMTRGQEVNTLFCIFFLWRFGLMEHSWVKMAMFCVFSDVLYGLNLNRCIPLCYSMAFPPKEPLEDTGPRLKPCWSQSRRQGRTRRFWSSAIPWEWLVGQHGWGFGGTGGPPMQCIFHIASLWFDRFAVMLTP